VEFHRRQPLIIRRASHKDLSTIQSILQDASAWLQSKGSDQWQRPLKIERIENDLENGSVYLGEIDGKPVATITVDDRADPDFWSSEDCPEQALYLHRMAVRSAYRGKGLGDLLIQHAEQLAKESGRSKLRLDAWRTNKGLQRYYAMHGWTYVRTVNAEHRQSGALFERCLTVEDTPNNVAGIVQR
jgi:GNAT superfamily N-acetyltransferase